MNVTANGQEFCHECSKILIQFSGSSIYIPKSKGNNHYDKINKLRKAGWKISELAGEFNLTVRAVYRILARFKQPPPCP